MRHKKYTKKRNQRGGVRFSDIITVENKDRFIGREIEIVRLNNDPNDIFNGLFDDEDIDQLMNHQGFIGQTSDEDEEYYGDMMGVYTNILKVNYPDMRAMILHIPNNLNEFKEDIFKDNPDLKKFDYYVKLKKARGPDLFTRDEMLQTHRENRLSDRFSNTFNPRLNMFSHGYIPASSLVERTNDRLIGPSESRFLPRDILHLLSTSLRNTAMEHNRQIKRSRRGLTRYLD